MTVTDATARPPLDLPQTVTITADLYEYLTAYATAGAIAAGLLDVYQHLGAISDTGLREWREAFAKAAALSGRDAA